MAHTTAYLPNTTLAGLGAPPLALEGMARAITAYYRAREALWQPAAGARAALQR